MNDTEVANHTLELLRRLNGKIDAIGFDVADIKTRMSGLEEAVSNTSFRLASVEVSVSGMGKRLDRIEGRLDRIERRLDLRDESEN